MATVKEFFHKDTNTWVYVVSCSETGRCAIIDSVWDYEPAAARTSTEHIDEVCEYVKANGYRVEWILDTHVHADHLSGMAVMKERFPEATTGIGARVTDVVAFWSDLLEDSTIPADGSQFDRLFEDGDTFRVGNVEARALHTPGHTPACMTYVIGTNVFVGDTIFMPDSGSARCDFPGGSAAELWASVRRILSLPPEYAVYVGHDYGNGGKRPVACKTSVGEELERNVHVGRNAREDEFVAWRTERDRTLGMPRLIIPSLQVRVCVCVSRQVNLRGGRLPAPSPAGRVFLKLPVNVL